MTGARPTSPAAPRPGVRSGWLHDRPVDLTLIFGVTLVACAMGGAAALSPKLFLPLLLVHSWLFSYDHVIATFTKLAGLPADRRRNRALIFYLPPLTVLAVLSLGQAFGVVALNSIYFFWQVFHMARQSWGLLQHYRRRAGALPWDPPWLSELTLWSIVLVGVLHRCQGRPQRFLYMELWTPAVPLWLVWAAALPTLALWLLWLGMRLAALRRGELPLGHTLYMLTHLLVFGLAYLWLRDLSAGWLLVNVWHNLQYLVYVWLHNRQRFAGGVRTDAPWLSWLSQPGARRAAAYFLSCLLLSTPLFYVLYSISDRLDLWLDGRLISLTLVAALSINFHHYLVDGLIWKRARDPAL